MELFDLIDEGNLRQFKRSVENNGANINIQNDYGDTPLIYAIDNNNEEIAEYLIKRGANINLKNGRGWTPLYSAVYKGDEALAELLIERGADINAQTRNGETPLILTMLTENSDMVAFLLEHRADVNIEDTQGYTPLMVAAQYGYEDGMQQLILYGADVNRQNNQGITPVMVANQNGQLEAVDFLVEHGADNSNITDPRIIHQQLSSDEYIREQQRRRMAGEVSHDETLANWNVEPVLGAFDNQTENPKPLKVVSDTSILNKPLSSYVWPGKCPICLDDERSNLCRVNCRTGHIFHYDCITGWRNSRKQNTEHETHWSNDCPVCNDPIVSMVHVSPEISERLPNEFGRRRSKITVKQLKKQLKYLQKLC
jgi:hypothetical protein